MTSKITTFILVSFLIISSCNRNEEKQKVNKEIPAALENNNSNLKSYGRSGDLTENLYQELVDKSSVLKQLEDDLDAFKERHSKIAERFNYYENKSKKYYNSANYKAMSVTDSLLRIRINKIIMESNSNFSEKTKEFMSIIDEISNNNIEIRDRHTIMKIILTLPLIEKYQDEHLPEIKPFKNSIIEQKNLILRLDSITPAY